MRLGSALRCVANVCFASLCFNRPRCRGLRGSLRRATWRRRMISADAAPRDSFGHPSSEQPLGRDPGCLAEARPEEVRGGTSGRNRHHPEPTPRNEWRPGRGHPCPVLVGPEVPARRLLVRLLRRQLVQERRVGPAEAVLGRLLPLRRDGTSQVAKRQHDVHLVVGQRCDGASCHVVAAQAQPLHGDDGGAPGEPVDLATSASHRGEEPSPGPRPAGLPRRAPGRPRRRRAREPHESGAARGCWTGPTG